MAPTTRRLGSSRARSHRRSARSSARTLPRCAGDAETALTSQRSFKPEDISRSLLYAISNNIGQIAYMNAQQHGIDNMCAHAASERADRAATLAAASSEGMPRPSRHCRTRSASGARAPSARYSCGTRASSAPSALGLRICRTARSRPRERLLQTRTCTPLRSVEGCS